MVDFLVFYRVFFHCCFTLLLSQWLLPSPLKGFCLLIIKGIDFFSFIVVLLLSQYLLATKGFLCTNYNKFQFFSCTSLASIHYFVITLFTFYYKYTFFQFFSRFFTSLYPFLHFTLFFAFILYLLDPQKPLAQRANININHTFQSFTYTHTHNNI